MIILSATEKLKKIENILQEEYDGGRHLFLAYGYTGYVDGLGRNIAEWLNKNKKRTLTMVIGLHQDRKKNLLLSAMNGEYTIDKLESGKLKIENSGVFDYIEKLTSDIVKNLKEHELIIEDLERKSIFDIKFRKIGDAMQEISNRINFYTYPGYHGKLFSIISDELEDLEDLEGECVSEIRHLIIGSANLSDNSFFHKTEVNIYSDNFTIDNIVTIRDIYRKLCLRKGGNPEEILLAAEFSREAESRKNEAITWHIENLKKSYTKQYNDAHGLPID
ncbi:hypothetical protein [Comamonas testosteroni]|uniref:hypothetical protein n=1 Tax=Comamonas testosteroni TaxID=285 RepID=UPI0012FF1B86|nr:hypothetical protein [Comamonas testosteroni]